LRCVFFFQTKTSVSLTLSRLDQRVRLPADIPGGETLLLFLFSVTLRRSCSPLGSPRTVSFLNVSAHASVLFRKGSSLGSTRLAAIDFEHSCLLFLTSFSGGRMSSMAFSFLATLLRNSERPLNGLSFYRERTWVFMLPDYLLSLSGAGPERFVASFRSSLTTIVRAGRILFPSLYDTFEIPLHQIAVFVHVTESFSRRQAPFREAFCGHGITVFF